MNTPSTDKNSLRSHCLAARAAITPAQARAASDAVSAYLLEVIPAGQSIVAGYLPIRHEINIVSALEKLAARGHRLCLPVVDAPDTMLSFRHWLPGQPLEKGAYGIDVPMRQQFTLNPEAIIVPLVAFDKTGHRLGYGAGYYDRTIEHFRKLKKDIPIIGVAYNVQEVDVIPPEPHDQILDAIVTEKGILRP